MNVYIERVCTLPHRSAQTSARWRARFKLEWREANYNEKLLRGDRPNKRTLASLPVEQL